MMKRFFTFALIAMLSCAVAYAQGSGSQRRPDGRGSGGGGSGGRGSGGRGAASQNNPKEEEPPLFVFPSRVQTFEANGVKFSMTRVDGGSFRMGATPEQGADVETNERPVHSVTLNTYYIGTNKVTQALWEAVMNNRAASSKFGDLPVKCVSWDDCQLFISRLNALTGRDFRLPTEAEWNLPAEAETRARAINTAAATI